MNWLAQAPALAALDRGARARLAALDPFDMAPGAVLYRPGDPVRGYAIVLTGRIDVSLTGASGREMLLYSVTPGQSCIQTTLGLLGDTPYSAEAVAGEATRLVVVPRALFLSLLDGSAGFRSIVFDAFAQRMNTMMHLLEKVAFTRVETRLADHLLALTAAAEDTEIRITQSELATRVGTAREVVSRRLDAWARHGWVRTGRGTIAVTDRDALRAIAENAG